MWGIWVASFFSLRGDSFRLFDLLLLFLLLWWFLCFSCATPSSSGGRFRLLRAVSGSGRRSKEEAPDREEAARSESGERRRDLDLERCVLRRCWSIPGGFDFSASDAPGGTMDDERRGDVFRAADGSILSSFLPSLMRIITLK